MSNRTIGRCTSRAVAVGLVAVLLATVGATPATARASSAPVHAGREVGHPGPGVPEATVGRVTRHPLAANAEARSIVAGSDGNLWFLFNDRRIGRLQPDGTVATFTHPGVDGLVDLTAGPDGNLWFTFAGRESVPWVGDGGVGRVTPGGEVTVVVGEFSFDPGEIVAGPDGNLWFAGLDIGRVTPAGSVSWFPLEEDSDGIDTRTITVGGDGRLWHDLGEPSQIGALSTSGVATRIALSEPVEVEGLVAGPGGVIWFEGRDNRLGTISAGGSVTLVKSAANWIDRPALGPDGNLWALAYNTGRASGVARVSPTGKVMFYEVGNVTSLVTGPDGNLWFTDSRAAGRIVIKDRPTRRPDGRIRSGTRPWVGNNAYTRAATSPFPQAAAVIALAGQAASLRVSAQNDGDAAEALLIRGQGSTATVTVAYFSGSTNVTARVVAGTYRTPVLAPGAEHQLRVSLTPTTRATPYAELTRTVTVRSANSAVSDLVASIVLRSL